MKVLGLTGGIGMGKSVTERLLRERAVPVADADVLARQLVGPGQPALAEIRRVFGDKFTDGHGQLCREAMAQLVFADVEARRKLESILHPRIRERWMAQVGTWKSEERSLAAVIIPLLFETKSEAGFDATICIACLAETQRQRLIGRGWTPEQIEQRVSAQWPIERKMAQADFVIWTEGGLDVHAQQLDRILSL
jgi:dephospho-CoA kinase